MIDSACTECGRSMCLPSCEIIKILKRMRRSVHSLNREMEKLRSYYPEANYYLSADFLNVMVGPSHDASSRCKELQENVLDKFALYKSGGGDW